MVGDRSIEQAKSEKLQQLADLGSKLRTVVSEIAELDSQKIRLSETRSVNLSSSNSINPSSSAIEGSAQAGSNNYVDYHSGG
jgi:hypothetical protein